jgi:hypothetical protein
VYVKDSGGVYAAGGRVVYADRGVRPALWLNLTPEFFEAMAAQRASRAEWQRKKTRGLALHQEEIQDEESAGRLKVSRHAERAKAWKSQGLCRYCGGKLGIFSGKCKSCSRQN